MATRKLPIGIQSFSDIIEGGYIYVDKTELIYKIVSSGKAYFLSRPRRFGKSLLVSTLDAYFNGRKELFTGLAMEKLETEWKKHPVFRFDMSSTDYQTERSLNDVLEAYLSKYEAEYGGNPTIPSLSLRFAALLKAAHRKTKQRCVILVDEYDTPMLDTDNNQKHLQLFKSFFGNIKKCDEHIQFSFLTGITMFVSDPISGDLNNLQIIDTHEAYSTLCGITQKELEDNFKPEIEAMAEENDISFDECLAQLKEMYDGYHFARDLTNVYNPFGLLNALDKRDFGYFWYEQSTPTILLERIKQNNWNFIDYVEGTTADAATLGNIEVRRNDPTPLLYQSGYLTIKDYDRENKSFILTYPNEEVRVGFVKAIVPRYLTSDEAVEALDVVRFKKDLLAGNLDAMFTRMKAVYAGLPYPEAGKPDRYIERDFRNVAHIIFTLLGGISNCESHFSHGRSDCIVEMPQYVYIFEFKLDKSADEALQQIDQMGYAEPFAVDKREVIKVGVSFSSKLRNIEDWKAVRQ